jgi:hypothetical protein
MIIRRMSPDDNVPQHVKHLSSNFSTTGRIELSSIISCLTTCEVFNFTDFLYNSFVTIVSLGSSYLVVFIRQGLN